ncbi:MAG TPA: hypothetical protein VIG88_06080 [Lysobacter sp.]
MGRAASALQHRQVATTAQGCPGLAAPRHGVEALSCGHREMPVPAAVRIGFRASTHVVRSQPPRAAMAEPADDDAIGPDVERPPFGPAARYRRSAKCW